MTYALESWPEAAVAIAGVLFVTVVGSVLIWQIFATGRTGLSAKRENAYRELAEASGESQSRTASALEQAVGELAELRRRVTELERLLKDVG